MTDKEIRIILNVLREGIEKKNWNTIKYVEGLLNMHTIEEVFKK